jgi:Tfp pilus assembly protein PilP
MAPIAASPSLRLSGIGSTGGVRTAVISDGTTVHLVKVGETVSGYAVVEISDDAVTIGDASGAQWKLRMK